MPRPTAITIREIGAMLAVLSLYVLVLLAPLHQAAGLQRDLASFGYETVTSWSVCQSLAADEDGDAPLAPAVKCPAPGLGKFSLAPLLPVALHLRAPSLAQTVAYPPHAASTVWRLPQHFGQSRAPPVPV